MFQPFPDDNKNEDFLNEFRQKIAEQNTTSFEERKNELNRSKSVFIGAVAGVVLAGIVGFFVLSPRYTQQNSNELPVIRRPQTAIKVQPTEPGGMEILNQDKSVYGILDKNEDDSRVVEKLLPPPEEPKLPEIMPSVAPQQSANIEDIIGNSGNTQEDIAGAVEKIIQVSNAPKATAVQEDKPADTMVSLSEIVQATPAAIPQESAKPVPDKIVIPAKTMVMEEETLDLKIPSGAWQVQLMSSNSKTAIEKSWANLSKKYNVLAKQPYEVESADLGAKGTFYRLKAGSFKSKNEADSLCQDIKAMGGTCIVKKK